MKITALLPMKDNSERIPYKNLKLLDGKPLYYWVLNNLIKSKIINNVIINTDSKDISNSILKNFTSSKIQLSERPKNLIGDYVSMNEIIQYDINNIDSDIFIQTHSTSPMLKLSTIDKALNLMINRKKKFDSIFSVTKIQKRFYDKNTLPYNHDPKMLTTQYLEPIFEENSCFYIFTKESFNLSKSRIGINPIMFELDEIESIDIDYPNDFKLAEIVHKNFYKNE